MNIGKTIKKLRLEKEMTQEQLAEKLNISVSAVSQWEIGKTMPDISMIPLLVDVFGVTADELLCIKSDEAEKRVAVYLQEADALYHAWKYEELVTLLAGAYAEFPYHMGIAEKYAFALAQTMQEHPERIDKCILLNEKILERSTDDKVRYRALLRMCDCYDQKGDKESLLYYVKKLPRHPHQCGDVLMRRYGLIPDADKVETYQTYFLSHIYEAKNYLMAIADPDYTNPCNTCTAEERICVLEQMINITHVVYGTEHLCNENETLYELHRIIGALYLFDKKPEPALEHFEKAFTYALAFQTSYKDGDCYTSPVLAGYEARPLGDFKNGNNTYLMDMRHRLTTQEHYKALAGHPHFIAILQKLEQALQT